MAAPYNHRAIEAKWRTNWEKKPVNVNDGKKPKYYCLDMFPYPSGNGLHVGHWRGYVISDVWSRYKMLQGYYLIHPMGWDAFGLPAENYAIKMGVHPAVSTAANIKNIKRQINDIAAIYDWDMEVNTTDPEFYKWTQWIFVKMFKEGLAYEKEFPINWCPSCKTGLANEEVVNGCCERCGTPVTKKNLRQWMLRITKYADRLLSDLDKLDWPEKEHHWIIVPAIIVMTTTSQIGDLIFSAIKRYFEVKDYSKLLPGHGGILDRIDSLTFNVLIFSFFLMIVGL